MTSPSPLLFDTYYHIYNRGNNREDIFIEERNYDHFINLFIKYIEPVADTLAYCFLRNYFHLMVRIKSETEIISWQESQSEKTKIQKINPSRRFSDLFNSYAKAINYAYGRTGSLFQHPFGRVMVKDTKQYWNVIAYIHQNLQKHKFTKDFRDWGRSSYRDVLSGDKTIVNRKVVLEIFGGRTGFLELNSQWVSNADFKYLDKEDSD
jgi:putative transposase